ncbi:hypothetical protein Y032_0016g2900 [Ancylostoma ceylanicum]|nr:hypothetical protein Y032_0016g2900 [Ancylostoma ceylanicum]
MNHSRITDEMFLSRMNHSRNIDEDFSTSLNICFRRKAKNPIRHHFFEVLSIHVPPYIIVCCISPVHSVEFSAFGKDCP